MNLLRALNSRAPLSNASFVGLLRTAPPNSIAVGTYHTVLERRFVAVLTRSTPTPAGHVYAGRRLARHRRQQRLCFCRRALVQCHLSPARSKRQLLILPGEAKKEMQERHMSSLLKRYLCMLTKNL